MTTKYPVSNNQFVTFENKEVRICRRKKNYQIAIADITKMFLKKRRRNFLSSIMGISALIDDNFYDLHILTTEGKDIKIKVRGEERPYFLEVISYIRTLRNAKPEKDPKRIQVISDTVAA